MKSSLVPLLSAAYGKAKDPRYFSLKISVRERRVALV